MQQLEALIQDESKDTSKLFFTKHVEEQMRSRRITKACVLETLRAGRIKRTPEPNAMKGSIDCKMAHVCAGNRLAVIVAVSDGPGLIVVTAMYA
ncbi:DUF4258 domain-containing protein [Massilia rubra]|uniref:DUF4258 domain-containing protein n=1 Tax=Massilia rubra TaxID=2607910 RepID=A0ABX0LYR2_9BURK|nr:DUF4258 domain-containing protein [Massilia rubra]NHZ37276.1 DUF4258 domain-containing protein [Massilia rubra]